MKKLLVAVACVGSVYAGEFVSLFNGKDFTGWGGAGKPEQSGYVIKEGGIIESTKKCRFLITEKEYSNYVFEFEFKLTAGANNGLGIHYPGKGDPAYTGMEIQILDNTHPKYAKLKDTQYHGSIYKLKAAKRGLLKPVGEWNRQKVTVNGPRIIVELNGTIITEANLNELEKKNPRHKGVKRRSGHLCFCGHGSAVKLRNLTIVELPD